ncbi:glycosyltransferase family 10 domain-containing protein [Litoreibacter albidus]|uniref:glycosyltransferase family 10 domain-containing protein n=1 Tax=Litoreibacter albidus TaxID=670155 RepID=UPI0037355FED
MRDNEPAYSVVPYNSWPAMGLANTPLEALHWPLGQPARLKGARVRDLAPTDHLIAYPNSELFYLPWFGIRAQVSVMIVEPDAVHAKNLKRAYRARNSFYSILTKSADLLEKVDNGIFFYFGSTFIDDIKRIEDRKTRNMSLIASGKRDLEGHLLRHSMVEFVREGGLDVDVMGRGYKPFERKEVGLQSYRFSIVIENVREKDYFTEKLVDAALCRTVPIYWGCPNIESYFDTSGMIVCETEEELRKYAARVGEDDYDSRLKAIEINYAKAVEHARYLERAVLAVKSKVENAR